MVIGSIKRTYLSYKTSVSGDTRRSFIEKGALRKMQVHLNGSIHASGAVRGI